MSPLTQLVVDALGFMNRSFTDLADVRSMKFEFYAQIRRLWDRGVPVGLGLGHVLFRPTGYGFEVIRIGEDGKPAGLAGVVGFGDVPEDSAGERILITVGPPAEVPPGVTAVVFDPALDGRVNRTHRMNPIDRLFTEYRRTGRKAFIPFLPAGDPDLAFTADALAVVATAGASLIEVGFPYSDPIADGPVIQASYTRALDRGLKLSDLFDGLKGVTSKPGWTTPIVGMTSYALVWRRGPKEFLASVKAAGLSGLVLPDLPAEEAADTAALARDAGLTLSLLVAPTTSPERTELIVRACTGFVYVVSVVGITGTRDRLSEDLRGQIARLRGLTDLPLCVGFGVSKPEHVRELKGLADGVIVGSALTRLLEPATTPVGRAGSLSQLRGLVSNLAAALG